MKPRHILASIISVALAAIPSTFGIAQDFMPVNWATQNFVAKERNTTGKNPETALVATLVKILESRPSDALKAIDVVIAENPTFRLAHLIKGDLLLSRGHVISTLGNTTKTGL